MSSRELNILVTAKNLASRTLGDVRRDVDGIQGVAKKAATNTVRNVGIATVAVGGLVATQVSAGLRSLGELERVNAQTDAVIKSTRSAAGISRDEIRKLASDLEDITTVDDKAIQNTANLELTFTNIHKKAFKPVLETVLDMNAAFGGDENSLQGTMIQVGKALQDPVRGLTALRRVGVNFNEQQQDRIKNLVKEGDLESAQKVILRELNKEFGGSAAAQADTYAGKMRKVGDAIEDAQMALATAFLPVLEKFGGKLEEFLKDPNTLKGIEDFGQTLADGFDAALDIASRIPWGAIGSAFGLLGEGAKVVLDMFTKLPPWVQTAVITGWGLNKITGGALGDLGKIAIDFFKGRGSTPINPLFVQPVGGGLGGPGAGAPGGAGGKLGKLLGGALAVGGGAFIGANVGSFINEKFQGVGAARTFETGQVNAVLASKDAGRIENAIQVIDDNLNPEDFGAQVALALDIDGVRSTLEKQKADLEAQLVALGVTRDEAKKILAAQQRTQTSVAQGNRYAQGLTSEVRNSRADARAHAQSIKSAVDTGNRYAQSQIGAIEGVKGAINSKDFSPNVSVTAQFLGQFNISASAVASKVTILSNATRVSHGGSELLQA